MSDKEVSGNESSDEYNCPWDGCDYTSHSEHGIKCHHSQTHGESIRGEATECEVCGDAFRYRPHCEKGRFCSNDCYSTWLSESQSGEGNPNWKAKVSVECAACGTELKRHPCRIERQENHFCDITCRGEWQSEHRRGENHPNYDSFVVECDACGEETVIKRVHYEQYDTHFCDTDCMVDGFQNRYFGIEKRGPYTRNFGERDTYECELCGSTVEKRKGYPDVQRHFCNAECHNTWQLEHGPKGMDHWNWRGGRELYYSVRDSLPGPSWYRIAKEQMEQAGRECTVCGEYDGKIDVHHIVPVLSGGTNVNELLMPLCPSHHMATEWYIRQFVGLHLVDWSEDELPEGRVPGREYMANIDERSDLDG